MNVISPSADATWPDMHSTIPTRKDLVLVGGGHSHALVLRKMGMHPWPAEVQLTLITNLADTPYSGMLPCHISGLYDFDTAHIDLRPLTRFAGCRLVMDEMVGLDAARQKVICQNHPPIAYDALSIDIGSTPAKAQVPGAAQYAIPAKPVPNLLRAWDSYLRSLTQAVFQDPNRQATIAIVGGGVGGVEMAFAMQVRLKALMASLGQNPQRQAQASKQKNSQRQNPQRQNSQIQKPQIQVHIFQRGLHLAKGRNRRTQRMVEQMCKEREIVVHTGQRVSEVTAQGVRCESGLAVTCDRTFWVTNASAPSWLANSGLSLTTDGFIAIKDTLQTTSHDNIFAAGDVATMVNHPRPKAGVFAVRQGPPLYENLKRHVTGQPLKPFKPQRRYLNIIDTDTEKSIASWGVFAIRAKWCRAWKHSIDRKFMGLFSDFPPMTERPQSLKQQTPLENSLSQRQKTPTRRATGDSTLTTKPQQMHCAGCGSKVGKQVLSRALTRVRAEAPSDRDWPYREHIVAGLDAPDDAAIVKSPAGMLAVHTVDQFTALLDDPFIFGQICVNHGLSDLFAMGATPHSVLATVTVPYGTNAKQEETLYQLLSGAMKALAAAKTFLVGGHTTEGPELSLGFACNGWIDPNHIWRKAGMQAGQSLILTKALGTGTVFAADQQLKAKGRWIESAVSSMLLANQQAATCLKQHGATACTDVTGFGLAGHLLEMAAASQVNVALDLNQIARLPGADTTLNQGLVSSLHARNLESTVSAFALNRAPTHLPQFQVLFDPQTSGGLLASVPSENAKNCVQALRQLGYEQSQCIGTVHANTDEAISQPLTIRQW